MRFCDLYRRRPAGRGKAPLPPEELSRHPTMELLLALVYNFSDMLSENPTVWRIQGSSEIVVLFENSAVLCEDILSRCQELMACVSRRWPLAVLGSTPERETGELSAHAEEKSLVWETHNVSGRRFDSITNVCVQVSLSDEREAAFFQAVLERVDYRGRCIALPRQQEAALRETGLLREIPGSLFCYLALEEETDAADWLESLSIAQKEQLWLAFLTEGVCPAEFDWLAELYRQGRNPALLEWELGLMSALLRAGITVVNSGSDFRVTDREGGTLRFDSIHGSPAEKVFLKLLFPVKPEPKKDF